MGVVPVTVALITSVALVLAESAPTRHVDAGMEPWAVVEYVPCDAVYEVKVRPAGSGSSTRTSVARAGPALLTVIVKLTVDPGVTLTPSW